MSEAIEPASTGWEAERIAEIVCLEDQIKRIQEARASEADNYRERIRNLCQDLDGARKRERYWHDRADRAGADLKAYRDALRERRRLRQSIAGAALLILGLLAFGAGAVCMMIRTEPYGTIGFSLFAGSAIPLFAGMLLQNKSKRRYKNG